MTNVWFMWHIGEYLVIARNCGSIAAKAKRMQRSSLAMHCGVYIKRTQNCAISFFRTFHKKFDKK